MSGRFMSVGPVAHKAGILTIKQLHRLDRRRACAYNGCSRGVAQLVARVVRDDEAAGSSPAIPDHVHSFLRQARLLQANGPF